LGSESVMRGVNNLDGMKNLYNQGFPSFHMSASAIFSQYLNSLETMIDLILTQKKTTKARKKYFKIFFGQLTNLERIVLLYHFNLGAKPKNYDEFKHHLFEPLKNVNEVYTPHSKILDGIDWTENV